MTFRVLAASLLATAAFSQDAATWTARGIDAYRHTHFDESIKCFEEAVKLDPNSADAPVSLAIAYLGTHFPTADSGGNPMRDREIEQLTKALALDPRNEAALEWLAALYWVPHGDLCGQRRSRHRSLPSKDDPNLRL